MNIFTTGQSQFDYNKATQKVNNSFFRGSRSEITWHKNGVQLLSAATPQKEPIIKN